MNQLKFWDTYPTTPPQSQRRLSTVIKALPVPDTGWKMPDTFPDLTNQGAIAIDVETYDPDLQTKGPGAHRGGYICGVAIGTEAGFRQYYPIAHKNQPNLDRTQVLAWLQAQLATSQAKIGANIKYDLEFLARAGVNVQGPFYDIQVADPLLDENQQSYSLEAIAQRTLGEGKKSGPMETWLGKGVPVKNNIWQLPPQLVGPYAEADVDLPLRIFAKQSEELKSQGLWDLFQLESKLIPMLLAMRLRGVRVDVNQAQQLRDQLVSRQRRLTDEIGSGVNIWAADSIAKAFDKLGINYPRTATNKPSFTREWLEQHPSSIAKLIAQARRTDKFRGTFVEGYILEGHTDGRIHCEFHQLRGDEGGTVSGRFSSSNPNLQNLPIRDPELGQLIRSIFIPELGQSWFKLDWSQIEFRLAVHYAAALKLRRADEVVAQYHSDPATDYHRFTAELTGLPRSQAKNINFGIIYGLGIDKLCLSLGIDRGKGDTMLRTYHQKLPFVKPLYNAAQDRARDTGEIKTLLGRKRRFELDDDNQRQFVHKALNALLQGSAADIMKTAMVQIWESGALTELGAPHLTVHDELDGSLPPTPAAQEALAHVRHIMESCVQLKIPMICDLAIADNWGKTKN